MKAISLWQPWASLVAVKGHPDPAIAALGKGNETRSKAYKYRGPLAIHAALKRTDAAVKALLLSPFCEALEAIGIQRLEQYPTGGFILVCDLVDCVEITPDNLPPEPELSFGDYTPGRFMWKLANIRPLPQLIPARGRQFIWTPEAPVLEQLERFYRAA